MSSKISASDTPRNFDRQISKEDNPIEMRVIRNVERLMTAVEKSRLIGISLC